MKKYMPLWPCVSRKTLPHDVVEVTTLLKMWMETRKGEDDMTVNQELDCDGRVINRGNLSRTIPWTHNPFKKSTGVCFWILRVDIYPLIG